MTAPQWNAFGQFIIDEVKSKSCIGNFFTEGVSTSVPTSRENVKYGFQFWVYNVDGESAITMTGHGGLFNILSVEKNTVISIFSIDEKDISLASIEDHFYLKEKNKINKIDILFKKIEKDND